MTQKTRRRALQRVSIHVLLVTIWEVQIVLFDVKEREMKERDDWCILSTPLDLKNSYYVRK